MITIYTIAFNEEIMLPFFIKHYRSRFTNCNIVVYDNYSEDNTEKIAIENNCQVVKYDTNGKLSDSTYLNIKNNVWKDSDTDWVLVCDVDELLDINEEMLVNEEKEGVTLIKGLGFDMINLTPYELNIDNMTHGVRSPGYDKTFLFNKKHIKEINYSPGCHTCRPMGNIKYNTNTYNLYHMNYVEENYKINRYKKFKERLSDENKIKKWGIQYSNTEQQIIVGFNKVRKEAKKIL